MHQRSMRTGSSYDARKHLVVLQSLCREVQAAYSALGANRLPELQQAIARQEELCDGLKHAVQEAAAAGNLPRCRSVEDQLVARQVRAAHRRLADLSLRYAGLLRRCARSAELLSLYYQDSYGERGTGPAHAGNLHHWSLEV